MINNKDIAAIELSPTAKDYYQIWNELLETAKKLSARWDPTTTNESDPGIVLLKVITAIVDRLNFQNDITALEVFMPSASEFESMQKLCNMMGYNIKYYQSATTDVTLYYSGQKEWTESSYLIPMFTAFTNADKSINYFTTEPKYLTKNSYGVLLPCIEGQVEQCESDNDNIISIYQLDDNHRYYFSETQVAQNGIFVFNINDGNKSERWTEVDNLNSQQAKSKVYKFGFDSRLAKPFIEFPEDISSIIEDGLEIYYTRTSGISGNISARELSAFVTVPSTLSDGLDGDSANYTIVNASSSTNGANIESIPEAYTNYKKTIGTFDTLINCRDYMNKIYQLKDDANIDLVSNCLVSDINNDINHSIKLCTYNDYGIYYKNVQTSDDSPIDNFTLTLYPFKRVNNLNTKSEYLNSFKLDRSVLTDIETKLENLKTLVHKFRLPSEEYGDNKEPEIVAIKNYLQLKAIITTTERVNKAEQSIILANIKTAIYENFNLRKLDFSEQIPYESILEVITNADKRIKNVNLDEPTLLTKFLLANNNEYSVASTYSLDQSNKKFNNLSGEEQLSRKIYNKLALRNILAGKLELFNYNTEFKSSFTEAKYPDTTTISVVTPSAADLERYGVIKINTSAQYDLNSTGDKKLTNGEIIQFRSKNLRTTITYPAYVNYYLSLKNTSGVDNSAKPASFITLYDCLMYLGKSSSTPLSFSTSQSPFTFTPTSISNEAEFNAYDGREILFVQSTTDSTKYNTGNGWVNGQRQRFVSDTTYYTLNVKTADNFYALVSYIKKKILVDSIYYDGIYKCLGASKNYIPGYLIDQNQYKYTRLLFAPVNGSWTSYFVQDPTNGYAKAENNYSLGKDAVLEGLAKNGEYQLKDGEFLLINYTNSETEADGTSQKETLINKYYGKGTIIRPNFKMVNSIQKFNAGSSYTKTDIDFKTAFDEANVQLSNTVYSLFTLGSDEQIEIREFADIYLDSNTVYLYWNLNNSSNVLRLKFESKKTIGGYNVYTHTYTLSENEYIYYSDQNQLDMAYYGNGTKISMKQYVSVSTSVDESELLADRTFYIKDKTVNNETILTEGLRSIPWQKFNFDSHSIDSNKTFMVLTEYNYINLIEGDYIVNLELDTEDSDESESSALASEQKIGNDWVKIKQNSLVSYYSDGVYQELPKLDFEDKENYWEVSCKLVLNCGPDLDQTLVNTNDTITLHLLSKTIINDIINNYNETGADIKGSIDSKIAEYSQSPDESNYKPIVLKKTNRQYPLNLKSNYELRNAYGDIYTLIQTTDSDTGEDTFIYDFKVKSTSINNLTTALNTSLNQSLHNVSDNLTRFSFNEIFNSRLVTQNLDYKPNDDNVNLSLLLPIEKAGEGTTQTNWQYGIVMIYYIKNQTTKTNVQDVAITLSTVTSAPTPKIFGNFVKDPEDNLSNVDPAKFGWWNQESDSLSADTYYNYNSGTYYKLKPGINILYIPSSITLKIYPDVYSDDGGTTYKLKCEDSIIISDLSLVNATSNNIFGINLDLVHYYITTKASQSDNEVSDIGKQLILDISKIDKDNEFFYNSPINNNNAIDINTKALDVNGDNESLQSPNIWYSRNNVNNPYVISEIDIKSVDSNIQIARSSMKN